MPITGASDSHLIISERVVPLISHADRITMGSRGKAKKLSRKQKAYKDVVKARTKTPAPPVQYTRRLKTRKQKKLKVIAPVFSGKGVGDTKGMTREDSINRMPKQGKHESDSHYIARLHKEVEDEMAKIEFARKQKVTELIEKEIVKSRKKQKALLRLKARKERRQKLAAEKKITGWEHLKDEVKFNEVVQAPPTHLTKPKKVGGHKPLTIHALDRHLQT
ncbi:hypothetical protein FBUS_01202 [Fasciolopsis buskii]|uniref:Uncharacterized protein n=1 Tax=Fasciolopsis buskii TaxID=27845 RepID=A0A8E0S5W9_9TREM|nr:hypothetical protein FBUS_01202 [Fasciolopsis buski]